MLDKSLNLYYFIIRMTKLSKEKAREYQKKWRMAHPDWYSKHKEKYKECSKRWRQKPENKEKQKEYRKQWILDNPEKFKMQAKRHYEKHRLEILKKYKERDRLRRKLVIEHYGNKCACCGEAAHEFLAIDHIRGGGNRHRSIVGYGNSFYNWIIKNNFPNNLRILCHNCNLAKAFYGECPHDTLKRKKEFLERKEGKEN